MELGKPGWLSALIAEVAAGHRPPGALTASSGRRRARAYLRTALRSTGLLYGTPQDASGGSSEEALFLAVVKTLVRLAFDLAHLSGTSPARRREEVLLPLAALAGELSLAGEVDERLHRGEAVPRRLEAKLEAALADRATTLAGDPYYGLVLHNGAVYVDAQLFAREAIAYFEKGRFSRAAAERRRHFAARQKAVLVEVLTALVCAERPPRYLARRAILRQIAGLKLPEPEASRLKERVKRSFERRTGLKSALEPVRSHDMRRFLLEQTLLAALVDGRRSGREVAFLRRLAELLGFSEAEQRRVELEVAEFYAQNRKVVDVFTLAPRVEVLGEELVDSMQRALEKNFQRLLREVRETGELSVLLTRAARGQRLSAEERRKMREQLIDIAKAVPALAIFAAPGGVLLLIALAKVLPFDLLPSAFRDDEEPGERE